MRRLLRRRRHMDPRVAAALAYDPEKVGQARAWAFIRKVHAEHPNPARRCNVPDCCEVSSSTERPS